MDCQTVSMKSSKFRYNKHLIVEKHSAAMKNSFSLRKSANNQSSSHLVLWKNGVLHEKILSQQISRTKWEKRSSP